MELQNFYLTGSFVALLIINMLQVTSIIVAGTRLQLATLIS